MKPFVSVIVPCRNEAAFLGACLDSILGGDYPCARMELLIAEGGSADGSREIAEEFACRDPRVQVLDNPQGTTPAGLNLAIGKARGDVIVRLDGHSTIAPNYLTQAVEYLESTGAANVGGSMRTLTRDRGPFAEPICVALTSPFGVGNSRFRTGVKEPSFVDTVFGGCWRREVFSRIGFFNERLERGQDIEFNLRLRRAGGKILLAPGIESCYYARATLKSFWRRNWTNGVWAVLPFAYTEKMPVRWRHLAPLGFVSALASAALVAVIRPGLGGPALLLIAVPYVAVNLAVSFQAAWRKRNVKLALLLPVTFASLHLSYGAGSLWGAVRLIKELRLKKSLWRKPVVISGPGMKRTFDFLAALIGLLTLAPVLAILALAVWTEDRHAPLYRGIRIARGGGEFRMLKFRTMVPDAWRTGVSATASGDLRITRVGRGLRAAKLDELPQLWNVLAGEMSLVGPRPQVPADARLYTADERRLFELRPGITDLASIVFADEGSLLRGAADPDLLTQQILRPWKSRLALAYREHAGSNVFLDLRIIGLTLLAAVSPPRARAGVEKILAGWHADPLLRSAIRRMGSQQPPAAWPPPGASTVVERYPRP